MGSIFQGLQQNKKLQRLPVSLRPAESNVLQHTTAIAKHNNNSGTSNNNNANNSRDEEQSGQLGGGGGGIRRRLSSLSLKMQIQLHPSSSAMMTTISSSYRSSLSSWAGAFRRSKSEPSMVDRHRHQYGSGDSIIRKWWEWGWGWILSCRKPTFAKDLEMNEAETAALGWQSKGSWRHIFYKVKSELGKLLGTSDNVGLPQTIRYHDSPSACAKNFDRGIKRAPLTSTQY